MKIYKNILNDGTWNKKESWSLSPTEEIIILPEKEKEYSHTKYAVEYETERMTVRNLMTLLFRELPLSDVKLVCENDKKLEQLFLLYITNITD